MGDFEKAWGVCCDLLSKPEFKVKLAEFVDKNCDVFEDEEENKLEYTSLHNHYVEMADDAVSDGLVAALGSDFDMVAFLQAVPGYLEKVGKGEEKGTTASEEAIDVLLNFTSFESFKETMLLAKKNKKSGGPDAVQSKDVTLDEEMKKMLEMADTGEWRVIKQENWFKAEMTTSPDGIETMRAVIDTDLKPEQILDMCFAEERPWDEAMKIEVKPNDRIKFQVKYPYLPKFEYDVKMLLKHDFPNKGCITWVYRALQKDGVTLDMSKGAPVGKGYVMPQGEGSQMCTIEEIPSVMKFVPTFLLNWFLTSFMLKMLSKQISKYKKARGIN